MSIGIICCQSLAFEIKTIIRDIPEVTHMKVLNWKLHNDPDLLLKTVIEEIEELQNEVDAIMLGYGTCAALDRLPNNFNVPVFRPDAADCIGVLLGQGRYDEERCKEPGTWFLTRGWTEISTKLINDELQPEPVPDIFRVSGKDPKELMRQMLQYYKRGLLIETSVGDQIKLKEKAIRVSEEFGLEFEKTRGSLQLLEETLREALNG